MPKIIVSMWTTLDGMVAGPQDEMDWLLADDELQSYETALVQGAGALLLGRVTHGDFAGYWPGAARDPELPEALRDYASRIDELDKLVVSSSGRVADWNHTTRLAGLDPDEVARIKQRPGGDVIVYGSLGVVRTLTDLGLVDEFQLLVHPVLLGAGKPMLDADRRVRLDLIGTEAFTSGVVLMRYRLAPADDSR